MFYHVCRRLPWLVLELCRMSPTVSTCRWEFPHGSQPSQVHPGRNWPTSHLLVPADDPEPRAVSSTPPPCRLASARYPSRGVFPRVNSPVTQLGPEEGCQPYPTETQDAAVPAVRCARRCFPGCRGRRLPRPRRPVPSPDPGSGRLGPPLARRAGHPPGGRARRGAARGPGSGQRVQLAPGGGSEPQDGSAPQSPQA